MILGVVLGMLIEVTKARSFESSPEGVVKRSLFKKMTTKMEKQEKV